MPETGNVLKAPVYKNDNQTTKVFLQLPPEGSVFVVLREQSGQKHIVSIVKDYETNYPVEHGDSSSISPVDLMENQANEENMILFQEGKYTMETESGTTDTTFNFTVSDIPSPIELSGPWDINFPSGWRAPSTAVFPGLISWTACKEEGIKYFSGIETYRKVFDLPGDLLKPDNILYLDLERVKMIADVYLNKNHLGILWKPPFRLDITKSILTGKNTLIVEVANDWSNRIVGTGSDNCCKKTKFHS